MKTAQGIIAVSILFALAPLSADAWKETRRAQRQQDRATAPAEAQAKDPMQFDCREVVGRSIRPAPGSKRAQQVRVTRACPHEEMMEAGLCETHWLRGMRCIEQPDA